MKRLEQLPEITSEMLAGLTADYRLKNRILSTAKKGAVAEKRALRPAIGLALSLAVVVTGVLTLFPKNASAPDAITIIHSIAAGQGARQPDVRGLLDLPQGSIKLTAGSALPEYRSIWAPKNGTDFPLVAVEGRYYRLMRNPSSISDDMLSNSLGTVAEYTTEPSLSKADTVMSNVVSQGEAVYSVSGMSGALVAAKVDGTLRVFQRVSYSGNAKIGKESLNDTLKVSGKVVALELSGVGTITDGSTASALVKTLLDEASYQNASLISSDQSLLIQLDSGITMQLLVKGDTVSACGSWSCPEFFEAFAKAVE